MSINSKRDGFILVGKVGAPVGLDGCVKITSFTESAEDIFDYCPWHVKKNGQWTAVTLEISAVQGKYLVARIVGCDNRDNAQQWTNSEIAITRSQLPELPAGQYYWSDLEGLTVKTMSGLTLGIVEEVMETGAHPVLVIQGEQRHLVPYVPEKVVKEVNLASNNVIVDWDFDF
jgi:16S rRNA processing protein RimM